MQTNAKENQIIIHGLEVSPGLIEAIKELHEYSTPSQLKSKLIRFILSVYASNVDVNDNMQEFLLIIDMFHNIINALPEPSHKIFVS